MTEPKTHEKGIHFWFEANIILKAIGAVLETITGLIALFVTPDIIARLVNLATEGELIQDPNDRISNYLLHVAQSFSSSTQTFLSLYLLSHGIVKGIVIWNLLKGRLWAYPASIYMFAIFVIYQIYRYTHTHSGWLIFLTVYDLVIMWLIWLEYKTVRRHLAEKLKAAQS